jgi:hypothetical protein
LMKKGHPVRGWLRPTLKRSRSWTADPDFPSDSVFPENWPHNRSVLSAHEMRKRFCGVL